ncbi:MAG: right-handed parallel beta-helix repeat-containing protein [Planctomycetota bacterium]|jgi:hypothetical protein|nr:right-handed parallel beta-helix repeat-containing protein [Planctomycetota bacterium]MDP6988272.1 right-handed parallel beta-helix repeat-containing protein [Planctomycetota bacterium]
MQPSIHTLHRRLRAIGLAAVFAAVPASMAGADTFHVTTTADTGPGSLRDAILLANANAGPDDVVFDVSGAVFLGSALPPLVDDGTSLLGTTAPDVGLGPDLTLIGTSAFPGLILDGAAGCAVSGLRLMGFTEGILLIHGARGNVIGGTHPVDTNVVTGNTTGIVLRDLGTDDNKVYGNVVKDHNFEGILLSDGPAGNLIGGTDADEGNLVFANGSDGIHLWVPGPPVPGVGCDGTVIQNNHIGTDAGGVDLFGNGGSGIVLDSGVFTEGHGGTVIADNVIIDNQGAGVRLLAASSTVVRENMIGVDGSGGADAGNGADGVYVFTGFGTEIGPGNVISGNGENGVLVRNSQSDSTRVTGNHIGMDVTGLVPLGNDRDGVLLLHDVAFALVADNLISGNGMSGVHLAGNSPYQNVIEKNLIGLDASGQAAAGNGLHGVHLTAVATDNLIRENTISANGSFGIADTIVGSVPDLYEHRSTIQGNRIGTDVGGNSAQPNGSGGIRVQGSGSLIGGTAAEAGNLISGNDGWGITAWQSGGMPYIQLGLVIQGNEIGMDVFGGPLGNADGGVHLGDGYHETLVGGDPALTGAANEIVHNAGPGVQVGQSGWLTAIPVSNQILTNRIDQNAGDPIELVVGGNDLHPAPEITSVSATEVTGTNPVPGYTARIQVFGNDGVFLDELFVPASAANWILPVSLAVGETVRATATSLWPGTVTVPQTSPYSALEDGVAGTPFCFCPEPVAPCGNADPTAGCAHGGGSGATLATSGSASLGAADLVLEGSNLVPNRPGLYFQGDLPAGGGGGLPFGDGLRCVAGSLRRLEVAFSSGTGDSATTVNVGVAGGVAAGETKHYQLWYRAPGSSPCGFGFNLTNAVSVTWTD